MKFRNWHNAFSKQQNFGVSPFLLTVQGKVCPRVTDWVPLLASGRMEAWGLSNDNYLLGGVQRSERQVASAWGVCSSSALGPLCINASCTNHNDATQISVWMAYPKMREAWLNQSLSRALVIIAVQAPSASVSGTEAGGLLWHWLIQTANPASVPTTPSVWWAWHLTEHVTFQQLAGSDPSHCPSLPLLWSKAKALLSSLAEGIIFFFPCTLVRYFSKYL